MNRKCLMLSVLLGFVTFAVTAAEFANIDADGDGFVTAEEAASDPGLTDVFADFDRNKDGKLNAEEFDQAMEVVEPPDSGG